MNDAVARSDEEHAEAERHDLQYRSGRTAELRLRPRDWQKFEAITVPIHSYHASVKRLGDVAGLQVLDAGCGDGWLSVILAKRGAVVHGFDISREAIATACERAEANNVATVARFTVSSFYSLPYKVACFDAVIGQAILHHVRDKRRVAEELYRVMKPGAKAIFCEPFGNSLWLERLRLLVPVPSAAPDEPEEWRKQFKYRELAPFQDLFEVDYQEFHFVSRLDRVISSERVREWMGQLDLSLFQKLRWLRPYARDIVLEFRRPANG